jgi:hypothetical protein
LNVVEKLWDLANLTTGFAVAQSIATAFAVAKGDFDHALNAAPEHYFGIVGTLVFNALYTGAVVWCRKRASKATNYDNSLWSAVNQGRILAIWLFALVALVAFVGHLRNLMSQDW